MGSFFQVMDQIKCDLICEIIRTSQTNFLEKKCLGGDVDAEACEMGVMKWVQDNACVYREHFRKILETFPHKKLSEILKELTHSRKDLGEMLEGKEDFVDWRV